MLRIRRGNVCKVRKIRRGLEEVLVEVDGAVHSALNYVLLTGPVHVDDEVIINTSARWLNLGSGGKDLVIHVVGTDRLDLSPGGHIMKMRYTPMQVKVQAVEETAHYHEIEDGFHGLGGLPVVIGELHSMLGPFAVSLRKLAGKKLPLAYIMTDGGALPIVFSHTVSFLKEGGYLSQTITTDHAFGGDLETVNIYSALVIAQPASRAVFVSMGPGIVGTGSKYGTTALEQGQIANAVHSLGGRAVVIPRINFSDRRKRHWGISHHTLTVLEEIALRPCDVVIPHLSERQESVIRNQLSKKIREKHRIWWIDAREMLQEMRGVPFFKTMGRGVDDAPEFFLACGAGAVFVSKLLLPETASPSV